MNDCCFMRKDLLDTYGILKLQDKILEIMIYVDEFCQKHEIQYFLMGGSALGALRHGGFIPWDDDLDIFMDFSNLQKFEKCCELYLDKDRFFFQKSDTKDYPYHFSKVYMNGTTCMDPVNCNNEKMHQGIYIDIMCLNNAAPDGILRKIQYYCAALLKAKAVAITKEKPNTKIKAIQLMIADIVVRGPVKRWLMQWVTHYNSSPTEDVAHIFGRAKFKNSYYPRRLFNNQRYVPFETTMLAAPNGVEEYLALRYGEKYMEMPDEKTKAIYHSHAMKWDTERDYTYYQKKMRSER